MKTFGEILITIAVVAIACLAVWVLVFSLAKLLQMVTEGIAANIAYWQEMGM